MTHSFTMGWTWPLRLSAGALEAPVSRAWNRLAASSARTIAARRREDRVYFAGRPLPEDPRDRALLYLYPGIVD